MTRNAHFLEPLLKPAPPPLTLRNVRSGQTLATGLETAFDSTSRRRGLLGRDRLPEGTALVIAPCGAVHTFFMRFIIDIIFAGRDGLVVKTRSRVPPWRMACALRAFATIELPAGTVDRSCIQVGDLLVVAETSQPSV